MSTSTLPVNVDTIDNSRQYIEAFTLAAMAVLVLVSTYVVAMRVWAIDPEVMTTALAVLAIVAMLGGVAFLASQRKPSDEALEALAAGGRARRDAVRKAW